MATHSRKDARLRKKLLAADRGQDCRPQIIEEVRRLIDGEFSTSDFHELLLKLNICQWLQQHKPGIVDIPQRAVIATLQEILVELYAHQRHQGHWSAKQEVINLLHQCLLRLKEWMSDIPSSLIQKAKAELQAQFIIQERQRALMAG